MPYGGSKPRHREVAPLLVQHQGPVPRVSACTGFKRVATTESPQPSPGNDTGSFTRFDSTPAGTMGGADESVESFSGA